MGTDVTLTATPSTGHMFSGWSGDCSSSASTITIKMNTSKECTATFVHNSAQNYTTNPVWQALFDATLTEGDSTSVSSSSYAGIACPKDWSELYHARAAVTLHVDLNPGTRFVD